MGLVGGGEGLVTLDGAAMTMRRLPSHVQDGGASYFIGYTDEELDRRLARQRPTDPDFEIVGAGELSDTMTGVTTHTASIDTWPRFGAKVALATASLITDETWLDTPEAKGLQQVLWHGHPFTTRAVGTPGDNWSPRALETGGTLQLVRPPEHLLIFEHAEIGPALVIVIAGDLIYRVPLALAWGASDPMSWWFGPGFPKGRRLPADLQLALLSAREGTSDTDG